LTKAPTPLRHDADGFTLLELLIAIALLGLLTTILLAGFRFETRQVDRQATRLARSAKLADAYAFLRAHLAAARPIVGVNSSGTAIVFDGRSAVVSFVDAAPQSALGDGLYLYSVEVASRQLRIHWRPFDGAVSDAIDEAGDDLMLLKDVSHADLKYYGSLVPASGPAWYGEWRNAADLPTLIQLNLVFADGERAPALVVAPRLRLRQFDVPAPASSAAFSR
jgi:general secretion pathway protein J